MHLKRKDATEGVKVLLATQKLKTCLKQSSGCVVDLLLLMSRCIPRRERGDKWAKTGSIFRPKEEKYFPTEEDLENASAALSLCASESSDMYTPGVPLFQLHSCVYRCVTFARLERNSTKILDSDAWIASIVLFLCASTRHTHPRNACLSSVLPS